MMQVYPHQQEVFSELLRTAKTFFSGVWREFPTRPRFHRLVVGESGSGKSFLSRAAASTLGMPYWDCTSTNWIPLGGSERGARPTWLDVVDFVAAHERCVLAIDEIDKLGTQASPWMTCVRTEIFGLLDREVPVNLLVKNEPWDDDEAPDLSVIRSRLRESVFLVGAGAFQSLWDFEPSATIGFGATATAPTEKMHLRRLTEVLPVELLNRFAPPVLALPPLLEADYVHLLNHTMRRLDGIHRQIAKAVGKRTMEAAIRDRLGCRWIEQIMLETASSLTDLSSSPKPSKCGGEKKSDLLNDLSEPL